MALKIITLEEGETFDDLAIEISILKMCSHPNIVKFYGGWKKGDELFVRSFAQYLSRTGLDAMFRLLWNFVTAALATIFIKV